MDLALLTFLGGLLALDGTSFGQFMVSRPLVAGTLTGWAVGDPVLGLLMGGILEFYFISVFPVGGGHFPEGGAPTLVAVATAVAAPGPAGLALGALMGFLWSRLGAISSRCVVPTGCAASVKGKLSSKRNERVMRYGMSWFLNEPL